MAESPSPSLTPQAAPLKGTTPTPNPNAGIVNGNGAGDIEARLNAATKDLSGVRAESPAKGSGNKEQIKQAISEAKSQKAEADTSASTAKETSDTASSESANLSAEATEEDNEGSTLEGEADQLEGESSTEDTQGSSDISQGQSEQLSGQQLQTLGKANQSIGAAMVAAGNPAGFGLIALGRQQESMGIKKEQDGEEQEDKGVEEKQDAQKLRQDAQVKDSEATTHKDAARTAEAQSGQQSRAADSADEQATTANEAADSSDEVVSDLEGELSQVEENESGQNPNSTGETSDEASSGSPVGTNNNGGVDDSDEVSEDDDPINEIEVDDVELDDSDGADKADRSKKADKDLKTPPPRLSAAESREAISKMNTQGAINTLKDIGKSGLTAGLPEDLKDKDDIDPEAKRQLQEVELRRMLNERLYELNPYLSGDKEEEFGKLDKMEDSTRETYGLPPRPGAQPEESKEDSTSGNQANEGRYTGPTALFNIYGGDQGNDGKGGKDPVNKNKPLHGIAEKLDVDPDSKTIIKDIFDKLKVGVEPGSDLESLAKASSKSNLGRDDFLAAVEIKTPPDTRDGSTVIKKRDGSSVVFDKDGNRADFDKNGNRVNKKPAGAGFLPGGAGGPAGAGGAPAGAGAGAGAGGGGGAGSGYLAAAKAIVAAIGLIFKGTLFNNAIVQLAKNLAAKDLAQYGKTLTEAGMAEEVQGNTVVSQELRTVDAQLATFNALGESNVKYWEEVVKQNFVQGPAKTADFAKPA